MSGLREAAIEALALADDEKVARLAEALAEVDRRRAEKDAFHKEAEAAIERARQRAHTEVDLLRASGIVVGARVRTRGIEGPVMLIDGLQWENEPRKCIPPTWIARVFWFDGAAMYSAFVNIKNLEVVS